MSSFDISRRKGLSNVTVSALISELERMPQNAVITACGDINVWLHVNKDDSYVCIDSESLDECYPDDEELRSEILDIIESAGANRTADDVLDDLFMYIRKNKELF